MIDRPRKPNGGYRVYSLDTVRRIQFVRQAQQIGFSLREIEELLSLQARPAADCSDVRRKATAKLEEVKRKITQLKKVRSALEDVIASCPGEGSIQRCTIIEALESR